MPHPIEEAMLMHGTPDWDDSQHAGMGLGADAQRDMVSVGTPPCEGCEFAAKCGKRLLACGDFYEYVAREPIARHWQGRAPSRYIFNRAMRA